jgi:multiple sugar transport system permease protein
VTRPEADRTPAFPAQSIGEAGVSVLADKARRRYSVLTSRDKLTIALMIGIPLFFDLALIWGPTIASIGLSFTNWHGIGAITNRNLVGLQNYQQLFSGSYLFFYPALVHNLIWLGFLMLVATPLGILMAVLLDREIRGTSFYQTVFYLPVVLSLAIIGIIWQFIYSQDNGFLDAILRGVGVANPPDWFGDSSLNLWAALVAVSWRHVGYIMLLYLAGLKSFDHSLREAAMSDGANEVQIFFRIVFPVMRPINTVVIVITTIEALRAFDIAYIINGGRNGLELLSTLITNNSLSEASRVGFGSAIAVVLLVISLVPIVTFLVRTARQDAR